MPFTQLVPLTTFPLVREKYNVHWKPGNVSSWYSRCSSLFRMNGIFMFTWEVGLVVGGRNGTWNWKKPFDTRVYMFSAAIFFSDNSYSQDTTNKYMYWCRLYFFGMYSTIWFVLQKWCFVNVARVCTTSVNRWPLLVSGELYIDKALRTIFVCLSYTVSKRCCANVRKVPLYLSRYAAVYNCRLTK